MLTRGMSVRAPAGLCMDWIETNSNRINQTAAHPPHTKNLMLFTNLHYYLHMAESNQNHTKREKKDATKNWATKCVQKCFINNQIWLNAPKKIVNMQTKDPYTQANRHAKAQILFSTGIWQSVINVKQHTWRFRLWIWLKSVTICNFMVNERKIKVKMQQ